MYCPGAFAAEDEGKAGKLTVTATCRGIYIYLVGLHKSFPAGKVANCPAS